MNTAMKKVAGTLQMKLHVMLLQNVNGIMMENIAMSKDVGITMIMKPV